MFCSLRNQLPSSTKCPYYFFENVENKSFDMKRTCNENKDNMKKDFVDRKKTTLARKYIDFVSFELT